jgi:DNA-binding MarR family transcriptional regulator
MARAEGVAVPTMSIAVHRLVKNGYVSRSVAADDGRAALVELTTKGRAASFTSATATRRGIENWMTSLDDADRQALFDAVRILDSLSKIAPSQD